ncbi:MAG: 4Fe-4S dicluster domain-containing protein [Desulfobacterales bacterium]|nr:4Fe-4S dicluster domain-containing protein [Desulfobacterales bacterium]
MYSKILVLRFSEDVAQKPVVCHLARDFDLVFNILNATILPGREGVMVMELSGSKKNFRDGVAFLKSNGIKVKNASREVKRVTARCTHCGACTAVCPTGALSIRRPEMEVVFDQEKCSICELCVPACPPRAMEVRPIRDALVE